MPNLPKLSYVLLSHNREQYIRTAVESAFAQDYEGELEYIFSDDCSTDRTYEILKECVDAYKGPRRVVLTQTPRNLHLLKAFFERHTFCTAAEVLGAAQSGEAAFGDMFSLTGERLGSFWAELPPEDLRGGWLDTVVDGLSAVEGVFTGEEGLKQRLLAILGDRSLNRPSN